MAALDDFLSFLQGASNSAASAVSAPVDGINWALGKVGVPVSKKPVGGSEWLKGLGFTAEPKNKTAGLLGEAVGGVLPIVAQAKAPQIAAGLNAIDDKAMDLARQGIERHMVKNGMIQPATVWHGSPHKFDKFDSSKIGTGEGAQVYGHGLYFAEAPDVAKSYQAALTHSDDYVDGQLLDSTIPKHFLARVLSDESGNVAAARESLQGLARPGGSKSVAESARQALQLLESGQRPALQTIKPEGSLYKVDLPDSAIAKMLDWDKPLSQQAPEVQRFFSDVSRPPGADMPVGEWLKPRFAEGAAPYWSDDMRKVGIPGIRYLDGGSRGTGQGTSNFVMFPGNEGLLSILERNGQRLP